MGYSNYVYIQVDEIKRETDKAFLCLIDGEEEWMPKSQIADAIDYEVGDMNLTLGITQWLASEKGLE